MRNCAQPRHELSIATQSLLHGICVAASIGIGLDESTVVGTWLDGKTVSEFLIGKFDENPVHRGYPDCSTATRHCHVLSPPVAGAVYRVEEGFSRNSPDEISRSVGNGAERLNRIESELLKRYVHYGREKSGDQKCTPGQATRSKPRRDKLGRHKDIVRRQAWGHSARWEWPPQPTRH
jgi:hypothetical protein